MNPTPRTDALDDSFNWDDVDHYPEMLTHAKALESELHNAIDALRVSHSCVMLFRDLVKGYSVNTALGIGALEIIEKVLPELKENRE